MWRDAAALVGAETTRLTPTVIEIRRGQISTRIAHEQTTSLNDPVASHLATDKSAVGGLLRGADIPVPHGAPIERGDFGAAESFLATATRPLIVKPAIGSGGAGVVGQIRSSTQLRQALRDAWRYAASALVQAQVVAPTYRLLILDGELLDVIRRPLPSVVGDGSSSIVELVAREAKRRLEAGGVTAGQPQFELDLDAIFALRTIGLGPRSTPEAGRRIVVKSATNFCAAEETESALGLLHASTVDLACRASAVVGLRLAGVDVVAPAPDVPLAQSGGLILELNPVPGLTQHLHVGNHGDRQDVAVSVLERLLTSDPG